MYLLYRINLNQEGLTYGNPVLLARDLDFDNLVNFANSKAERIRMINPLQQFKMFIFDFANRSAYWLNSDHNGRLILKTENLPSLVRSQN